MNYLKPDHVGVCLTSVAWLVEDRATPHAFWLSAAELLTQVKGGDRPAAERLLSLPDAGLVGWF